MKADKGLSLAHHFADLTDPRIDRSRLHELLDIVTIAICAVVAGADSWDDIEDFGKAKHEIRKRKPRTKAECDALCGESLDWFPAAECRNYLRHAGYISQDEN